MLAQLAFNLRLKSGGEETSKYAVKPKGRRQPLRLEAKTYVLRFQAWNKGNQVALRTAGGPAACIHATLIHAHWAGSFEDLEPARKGA